MTLRGIIQATKHLLRSIKWSLLFNHLGHPVFINGTIHAVRPETVNVGDFVSLNEGVFLGGGAHLVIEDNVHISPYACLMTGGLDFHKRPLRHHFKPIIINRGVWLGTGCKVLGGVTIGEYAVVGAGAVVTKDVEPLCVVAGVPAKVIRRLKDAKKD